MHLTELTEKVQLPSGVTAAIDGHNVTVKGPKGELTRTIGSKAVAVTVEAGAIGLRATNVTRAHKRTLMTGTAHLRNMVKGVTEGHRYKLKICSGHFPMTVTLKGDRFEVKNFIGEAVPRVTTLLSGCTVKVDGTEITVESVDKTRAGNQASALELLTRRPGFDPRVFQDGIYITEKDGKHV